MFIVKRESTETPFRYRAETLATACAIARRHGVHKIYWENEHLRNAEGRYYGDVLLHGTVADLERKAAARDYYWDEVFGGYEPPVISEKDFQR